MKNNKLAESPAYLEPFLDSLWLESGLSKNTVEAYRRDLMAFAMWLAQDEVSL